MLFACGRLSLGSALMQRRWRLAAVLLLACGGDETSTKDPDETPDAACDPQDAPLPNAVLVEASWDATCPDGMVPVTAAFCIDKYEAALVRLDGIGNVVGSWSPYHSPAGERVRAMSLEGGVPQGYISQVEAAAACAEAGKRLCTNSEWLRACGGTDATTYPYGATRVDGACNDERQVHPAVELFGSADPDVWGELDNACLNQLPASLAPSGSFTACITAEGALDMVGNLHEWTDDAAGTFRGGFYVNATINGPGCQYATTAHDVAHWDYSTGFRCCADR
jgi:formylglycine-generating enzyme